MTVFASHAQLSSFYYRFVSPGTEAVDAFSPDCSEDKDSICPPPGIIFKAIRYMKYCYAPGALNVPH